MNNDDVQKLLDKVKAVEKGEKLDLSSGEDLSVAIMNLISIEEHLFFTSQKTGRVQYLDLLNQVREMRKKLLPKIIKNPEGEEWCLSKHLLAGCMRLMEVGTKSLSKGDKKEAQDSFKMAYSLYELFWGINLKLLKTSDIEKVSETPDTDNSHAFMAKLGQVIKHAIDCCRE